MGDGQNEWFVWVPEVFGGRIIQGGPERTIISAGYSDKVPSISEHKNNCGHEVRLLP